ncbi:helix-turn-helix domain-containing protein [Gemmatimonas sp.]|jgi:predicted XRE-type DNA-binding protein|uniref:helix-turn-helix domain-containing protein n=1 Tax=Gemmatimonas sp. TaxID=1962908 RepID=UPI0031CB7824|nr:XRE family transcriptional regulator [Gemmatimonas sp.]
MKKSLRNSAQPPVLAIEESSGNVFADLALPDADIRMAKAQLARAVKRVIVTNDWTQAFAAKTSGLATPDMSDVCRGNLARFSLERLEKVLVALGVDIEVRLQPKRAGATRGALRVIDCLTP